jgi:aldose 1-epimerase
MKPSVQKTDFGKLTDGTPIDLYTLTNSKGLIAKVTNYGTIITELHVPDRNGQLGDIVLGFDNLDQYVGPHPHFGATIGRVANRIARGKFTLHGQTYTLAINNGPNHLHGGLAGFDKKVWRAEPGEGASVKFSYTSPDGEEGYPGAVEVSVVMTLTDANELSIDYTATTDQNTPVNLSNHSYFNLLGEGDVLGHEIMLSADYYTPVDDTMIPTGQLAPVKGTPFDFTSPKPIGSRFAQLQGSPVGYDHNYVINRAGKGLALAARVWEPATGRCMEVRTTQPGVQFYTGNFLDGAITGKRGVVYRRHTGFCLETQHYPDSVNHPAFPSTILHPGHAYRQTTVHTFSTK